MNSYIIRTDIDPSKEFHAKHLLASGDIPSNGLRGELIPAGLGRAEDFKNKDFTNKIALIERGEISYAKKVEEAAKAGAIAVLIYNNTPGGFSGKLAEQLRNTPALAISQEKGIYLRNLISAGPVQITLSTHSIGPYYAMSGTSMACPHVAGLAALLKSKYPHETPASIRARIMASTDPFPETETPYIGTGTI
ncbi:protein containing Protease-associated PA domain, partial [sediment metagenome]